MREGESAGHGSMGEPDRVPVAARDNEGSNLASVESRQSGKVVQDAATSPVRVLHARLLQPMAECAAGDAAHKSDVAAKTKSAHAMDMHGRR